MSSFLRHLWRSYTAFIDKQGFPIVVTTCVAIITATALFTTGREDAYVSPTPPVIENVSAAQLMQQSLREAVTPTPSPTSTAPQFLPPLDEVNVLRAFQTDIMYRGDITGVWAIHDAADLSCTPGNSVYAIADGTVLAAGQEQLRGAWLQIEHTGNVEALYAGLSLICDYRPGDRVFAGDIIGYAGNGLLDEQNMGAHLHLRVTRGGQSIDPLSLWEQEE